MPLTTRHVDGRRIDSTDDEQWTEVHIAGYKGLICPECTYGMYARKPGNMVRHFAHSPGYPRSCLLTAAESADHLRTKMLVAEAVRGLGWTAEIECPGDGWRADVLATSPSGQRRIAFEPQFATIHESTARERTQRHEASEVETVWLDARGQESLAELARGRLFYDEHDPRVGVQTFEGGRWSPRRLPLSAFIQRVCIGRVTHDGTSWADQQDREAAVRWARKQEERRADEERRAEAVREWHRKHAEERAERERREAEAREARRKQDQERQRRLREEQETERAKREQERAQEEAERLAQWERERPEREVAEEEARKRQEHERARREAEWRAANPWHVPSGASDEDLLALAARFLSSEKPFPDWIPVGDRIHAALGRRGLLRE